MQDDRRKENKHYKKRAIKSEGKIHFKNRE